MSAQVEAQVMQESERASEAEQTSSKEDKLTKAEGAEAGAQVGRQYQVELVEHALRENTIVNLGTGAGKTFVAVLTIKELAFQTEGEFNDYTGQRTVFLAHTVPLVKQQAEYIAKHTDLKVAPFYGEMKNIDSWSKTDWYYHFTENRVLVIICQVFLDMLNRCVIQPRQINLLIIDECHHATKNHPYVQIMRTIGNCPSEDHPRILGLSASLLAKKVKHKAGELEKGIRALESVLMSTARTSQDLQEVAKYATQPEEVVKYYNSVYSRETEELKRPIEGPLKFLHTKVCGRRLLRLSDLAKDLLDDLKIILLDLGPASAAEFVDQALVELRGAMAMPMEENNWDNTQGCLALTHLTLFSVQCKKFQEALGDSSKVGALLEELKKYGSSKSMESSGTLQGSAVKSQLRGIVFVERRYTASCLAKLLQKKSRKDPELRHIKCDYVVGHTASQGAAFQKKDTKMKSKQQGEVLTKFRKGRINLLISTSVIEEGVDVPKCNLVVRFDLPQNFRAYIQSKGRARDKPSKFILMVNEVDIAKVQMLNTFNLLEGELVKLCQEDRNQPSEKEMQEAQEDLVPPYMPDGKEGARATLGGSLQLLHRYCQKLPSDKYTKLVPSFTVYKQKKDAPNSTRERVPKSERLQEDEAKEYEYSCELELPIVCPIRETIESCGMPTKRDAERAAGLFAVEKLHKSGELNERFLMAPLVDSDDEDVQKEKRNPLAGTEKRARLYRNRTASVLRKCYPHADENLFLYVFEIRERSTGTLYQSIDGRTTTMGVLTGTPLPWWKIPEFSLHVKEDNKEKNLLVKVRKYPQEKLQDANLEVIRTCHEAIFSNLLCLVPPYLQPDYLDANNKYLVVPITLEATEGAIDMKASIDTNLMVTIVDPTIASGQLDWTKALEKQAVVTVTHRPPQSSNGLPELYEVVSIDHSLSPQSPFQTDQYASFNEYFKMKYGTTLVDQSQPGLKCKRLSLSRLKLFTSRFEQNHREGGNGGEGQSQREYSIFFPDVTKIHPLSSSFWKVLRCLPSLLWRMESLLLVDDLSEEVTAMTRIGRIANNDLLLTRTTIHSYQDAGFGDIPTQRVEYSEKDAKVEVLASVAKDQLFLRGPDNGLLLQALTPRAANDSINLERLESLGDSLLKLVTSLHLFTSRPTAHEEKLSIARVRRISNLNLRILAEKKDIIDRIMASTFIAANESGPARLRWILPCYKLQESSSWEPVLTPKVEGGPDIPDHEANYLYCRITDKCIADCVEALIGAYTVAGGLTGGIKFMSWLGVKIGKPVQDDVWFSNHPTRESLLIANSRKVFENHFGVLNLPREDDQDAVSLRRLIAQTSRAQEKLNYRFKNRILLVEAFTHSSYTRNRLTDCYQRLEFLGDAILDYLITSYAYSSSQSSTPQTMSELRAVVVNNTSFARLTVRNDLHKHLLHDSPALFKKIERFAEALNDEESFDSLADEDFMDDLASSSEESMQAGEEEEEEMDDDSTCDELEGLDPPKVLGDILEALAGAVFLDSGRSLETVWRVFKPLLTDTPLFEALEKGIDLPPITRLYHFAPDIKIRKRMVDRKYRCAVVHKGEVIAEAVADSLKNAKNMAALKALRTLGISN